MGARAMAGGGVWSGHEVSLCPARPKEQADEFQMSTQKIIRNTCMSRCVPRWISPLLLLPPPPPPPPLCLTPLLHNTEMLLHILITG